MNKTCRKFSENSRENNRLSPKRTVKCKCPKCEKIFDRNMVWTGQEPARKFCDECAIINRNYFEMSYPLYY